MSDNNEMIEQTKLAFGFIEKLYLETSYLIKEIEGILREEQEEFIIGRPAGYGISVRSSTGLESNNVNLWLWRKFGVFFVPKEKTKLVGGQTITGFNNELKILYFRFVLDEIDLREPSLYSGVIYGIEKKPNIKWSKFEHIMSHFQYQDNKMFMNFRRIDYEDNYMKLKGELLRNNLFEINDAETVLERIVKPSLKVYRKY